MPPLLFSVTHNWDTAVRKVLGFRTEVIVHDNGSEQRRRLREVPIEITSYITTLMDTQDSLAFRGALYNAVDLQVDYPQWEDELDLAAAAAIGDTSLTLSGTVTNRHYKLGSRVMLFRENERYEIVTLLDAVGNVLTIDDPGTVQAWPPSTIVVPIATGRILAPVAGTDFGDVLRAPTISIALDEDIAGVTDGGDIQPLVAASILLRTASVGFRNALSYGGTIEYYLEAYTADGLLIPDPVIAWSYTRTNSSINVFGSPKKNHVIVAHDGSASASADVTATVDGLTTTITVAV